MVINLFSSGAITPELFIVVLITELGTITFLHIGIGHPPVVPRPSGKRPANNPSPTKPRRRRAKKDEIVVGFVDEFQRRHGRAPSIPEMRARFPQIAKTTAWRYAKAA